jgi:hypothetical protein
MEYTGPQSSWIEAIAMSANGTAERLARARRAVAELIEIVHAEGRPGTEAWYRMLLDIRDTLPDSADSPDSAKTD